MSLSRAHLALLFICIVWGTTYLALRVGVASFPPFLFSAIRQISAGILLLGLMPLFGKKPLLNWPAVRSQVAPGILMIGLGNGLVGYAEKFIPSGLAALICALMPLYTVLINLAAEKRSEMNGAIWSGLGLGAVGLGFIFKDNVSEMVNPAYLWGVIATFFAAFSWAFGSYYIKKQRFKTDLMQNAALQLFFGGVFILGCSVFSENLGQVPPLQGDSLYALLYLILFGSVAAFAAFNYALAKLPVGLVSVYAYVNPVVAVLLGFFVLHESLNVYTVLALVVTVAGVFLLQFGYRMAAKKTQAKGALSNESSEKRSNLPGRILVEEK